MRKQIKRLSPHQNGKVFGVLMALTTLPFLLPMMLMFSLTTPQIDQAGNPIGFPIFLLFVAPFMYLIFGYISIAISCFFYNFIQKYIGGFEFEVSEMSVEKNT